MEKGEREERDEEEIKRRQNKKRGRERERKSEREEQVYLNFQIKLIQVDQFADFQHFNG